MNIDDEKDLIKNEILSKGYSSLRVSIFNNKDVNKLEWQTRIEYSIEKKKYLVYSLADRASIIGKIIEFEDFTCAKNTFFEKLDLGVQYNILRVKNNESPEYPSPLWDK